MKRSKYFCTWPLFHNWSQFPIKVQSFRGIKEEWWTACTKCLEWKRFL